VGCTGGLGWATASAFLAGRAPDLLLCASIPRFAVETRRKSRPAVSNRPQGSVSLSIAFGFGCLSFAFSSVFLVV
jgi:hypothetical protein